MSRYFGWIGSALGGAIGGTVIWFVVNQMWTVNGRGIFERMGGLFASPWTFGIGGSLIGAVVGIVAMVRAIRRERQLTELSRQLGLRFDASFPLEDLAEWKELRIVDRASEAWNRLTGEASGIPFLATDLRYVEESGENRTTHDQTVALVPADSVELPNFELQPRGIAVRLFSLVGVQGVKLDADELRELDPRAMEQFQSQYFLSSGLEELATRVGQTKGTGEQRETAASDERIRRLFTPRLLRFFAEHPGWRVEGAGRFLAIWRPRRLVPPSGIPQFVAESLAIRSALVEAASADAARRESLAARGDSARVGPGEADRAESAADGSVGSEDGSQASTVEGTQTRLVFTMLGAFPGFFAGGIGGGIAAMSLHAMDKVDHMSPWIIAATMGLFFGGAIGGLLLGGLFGLRVIAPFFDRMAMRRNERWRAVHGAGPSDQPITSRAIVDDRGEELTVKLPPLGLIAGGGGFLFFWSLFWNGMLSVMTPALVMSAVNGSLKDEAGQPTSVWFVLLFLTPFWVIGIGSAVALVWRARRRAEVRVESDRLAIIEISPFSRHEYAWPRDEIVDVRLETTRVRANRGGTSHVRHLSIESTAGDTSQFFGYRTAAEVAWLARLIRDRLYGSRPQ